MGNFLIILGDLYPLGQLPVLELENGETIAESHAIVRYLGNELGLYGKSNHDKVIIDQTLDSLKHVEETLWITYFLTTDPDAKVCLKNLIPTSFILVFLDYIFAGVVHSTEIV